MIDNFRRHRRIGALVFLVLLPACYNWQLAATAPVLPEDVPPGKVRITRADCSRTVFRSVRVTADTLVGFPEGSSSVRYMYTARPLGLGQRVPLTDITRLETRKLAVAQTVVLGLGIVLPLLAVVGLATMDNPWTWANTY